MTRSSLSLLILGANYSPEPTGNAPYTTSLAESLAAKGDAVTVYTTHPHYPAWRFQERRPSWTRNEVLRGVAVRRLRHYVPRKPSNLLRLAAELSFGLRASLSPWGQHDLALAVSPSLLSSALVLLRAQMTRRSMPFVVWVQDLYSVGMRETGRRGMSVRIITAIERYVLRRATRVIAIHERFRDIIVEQFGVDSASVSVVRNWTHVSVGPNPDSRAATRARLGWLPDDVIAVHSGNMGLKQGLENVVEAARLAQARSSSVKFVLVGDGSQRSKLEQLAESVGNIDFLPPVPSREFTGMLAAADVLLVNELAGVSEMAVPSKLTSYFASGRPVVAAADHAGITAAEVSAAGSGVVVEPGAPALLLAAVEELCADPEAAAQMGANGIKYQSTVLAKDLAVEKFDQALRACARDSIYTRN